MKQGRLTDSSGKVLVADLMIADGYFSRMRGLLFRQPLATSQGLLITPCKQVHTHFMGYSIHVLFLDRDLQVVELIESMQPWKMSPWVKQAYSVLELNAAAAPGISVGDRLQLSITDE